MLFNLRRERDPERIRALLDLSSSSLGGLPHMLNFKPQPPAAVVRPEELDSLLSSSHPVWLAVIGLVGLGLLLWLMIFKPF